jgi:hypothetical protein
MATKGYTHPEVEKAYTRARELCYLVGQTSQLASVLAGLEQFHLLRAEYRKAREFAEQFLALAVEAST